MAGADTALHDVCVSGRAGTHADAALCVVDVIGAHPGGVLRDVCVAGHTDAACDCCVHVAGHAGAYTDAAPYDFHVHGEVPYGLTGGVHSSLVVGLALALFHWSDHTHAYSDILIVFCQVASQKRRPASQ